LERIENKLGKEIDSSKIGIRNTPERKIISIALASIIISPLSNPIRRYTIVQAHLLPEIIGDMEWMK
jgi:hypothetical protein